MSDYYSLDIEPPVTVEEINAIRASRDDRYAPGEGQVTAMGYYRDGDGRPYFGAMVEFRNGPPDLTLDIVWSPTPVRIVRAADQPAVPTLTTKGE